VKEKERQILKVPSAQIEFTCCYGIDFSVARDRLHAVASKRPCTVSLAGHHIPQQYSYDKNQMI
jgi:hypothetical protein